MGEEATNIQKKTVFIRTLKRNLVSDKLAQEKPREQNPDLTFFFLFSSFLLMTTMDLAQPGTTKQKTPTLSP